MTKHMLSPPARAQDALFLLRTDASPEEVFKAIGRLRKAATDEIDRLIQFLDDTDGCVDLEDGADAEPSLGSHELPSGAICYLHSVSFGEIDVEGEHDGREPDDSGIGDLDGLREQLTGRRFPSGLQIEGVE